MPSTSSTPIARKDDAPTSAKARTAAVTPKVQATIPAASLFGELRKFAPNIEWPTVEELKDKVVRFPLQYDES